MIKAKNHGKVEMEDRGLGIDKSHFGEGNRPTNLLVDLTPRCNNNQACAREGDIGVNVSPRG